MIFHFFFPIFESMKTVPQSYSAPICTVAWLLGDALICQSPDIQNINFGNTPGQVDIPDGGVNELGDF